MRESLHRSWPRAAAVFALPGLSAGAAATVAVGVADGKTAGAAAGVAAIVGLGAAVVVDRRMQRLDQAEEARSARGAALLPLSLKLPPGSTGSVLALLAAEHAVVDFWGRQVEQDRLDTWLADPKSHPVLLVTGPVGVGKTRLVLHWGNTLGPPWVAGRLAVGWGDRALGLISACGDPAVVVVDGAAMRPDLPALLQGVAHHSDPKVRIVLIDRDLEGLRQRLRLPDPAGWLADAEQLPVSTFLGGVGNNRRRFDQAARYFAEARNTLAPPAAGRMLPRNHHQRTHTDHSCQGTDARP